MTKDERKLATRIADAKLLVRRIRADVNKAAVLSALDEASESLQLAVEWMQVERGHIAERDVRAR